MKQLKPLIFVLVWASLLPACTGNLARRNSLLPAIQNAWTGVRADALRGGAGNALLAEMDIAIQTGNPESMRTLWLGINEPARNGIELRILDREISVGVGDSLRERLRQFDLAIAQYTKRRSF